MPSRLVVVVGLVAAVVVAGEQAAAVPVAYADVVLADQPAAYYRLGEAGGGTAADASGHGMTGSYDGPVAYSAPGAIAGDADTSVTLSDAAMTMPGSVNPWDGPFTVEAWVRPLATPTWRDAILINESYQVNGFRFGYDAGLRPVFWTSESGGTGELTSSVAMTLDRWYHVAAVRSGTTVTILVNGAPAGSGQFGYLPPAGGGDWGASAGRPSSARFDEVAVYPTALPDNRILAHYQAGGDQCQSPTADVTVAPGQDIQQAVDANPPGTTFLLGAGVHRLATVAPKAGNTFSGALSADCTRLTTLNGARLLTSFTASGGVWFATGQDQEGQVHGDCEPDWPRCNRPEDLFLDDQPLRHVSSLAEVGPGRWFFDYAADRVYLGDDPAGHRVEIGTARVAFSPSADNVTIRGLVVEKYAIPPQMGAIGDQYPAAGWRVENNEVRLNHGAGVNLSTSGVARDNHVHHNGQKGIGATGAGVLVESNEIAYNNYAHIASGWEAGGTKFALTTGLVVRSNCVHDNRGPGLWTDIDNVNTLYENNIVFGNYEEGIFHEISYDVEIRGNRVGRNGVDTAWLYGANIFISTSENANVHDNYVEVDPAFGHGITIVWQDRYDEAGNPYRATGSQVHDNEVTYLGATGETGAAADFAPATTDIYLTNSFSANTYHTPDPAGLRFVWADASRTFTEFQSYGQDVDGSIDGAVTPRSWSCDG